MNKFLIFFLAVIAHCSVIAQIPSALEKRTLIVTLYDFPEFTDLLTQAYEEANSPEKLASRKDLVLNTSMRNNRQEIGDIYGIAIDSKLVEWIGVTMIKTIEKYYSHEFVFAETSDLQYYPTKDFPYVLSMSFEFTPDETPFQVTLVFHLHDRMTNDQMEINPNRSRTVPFYYWASQRGKTPFYGTARNGKFKKELRALISELSGTG